MRRLGLAAATCLLAGAAPPAWHWSLPAGVAPPPVPADNPMSAAKVALGRRLFYDADLSIDGTMACATCHEQHRGFADGNATHGGVHGSSGRRNVPGLANVAWTSPLTWADPRATTLDAQSAIPLVGATPVEMGMAGQEPEIARRLRNDPCYRRMLRAAFPEWRGAVDWKTIGMALASFQRTFISFGSPYDRGDAPTDGAQSFAARCAGCHAGPNFSDGAFHRILPARGPDEGLADVTHRADDIGRFRTPSLRNAAVTGPWLHDGSAATLEAAIRRHGLPINATEMRALTAFLEALTDRDFLARPALGYPDRICAPR